MPDDEKPAETVVWATKNDSSAWDYVTETGGDPRLIEHLSGFELDADVVLEMFTDSKVLTDEEFRVHSSGRPCTQK